MTWTVDEMLIELRQVYGADLSWADCWRLWKIDNPDYSDATALTWYVTNGAIGDTFADAAYDYWHSLAIADQLLTEAGIHIRAEDMKFLITEG